MCRVMRMHRLAWITVGEFGSHGLPENDPAGGSDQRDAGGIGKGPVTAVDRRAVLGRHVGSVDDILDPYRNPAQQASPTIPVDGTCLGQSLFRVEPDPGLDLRASARPFQAVAGQ